MKELITELINRLESEASSDASHKSYCDDELAKVSAKKEDFQTQVEQQLRSPAYWTVRFAVLQADPGSLSAQ